MWSAHRNYYYGSMRFKCFLFVFAVHANKMLLIIISQEQWVEEIPNEEKKKEEKRSKIVKVFFYAALWVPLSPSVWIKLLENTTTKATTAITSTMARKSYKYTHTHRKWKREKEKGKETHDKQILAAAWEGKKQWNEVNFYGFLLLLHWFHSRDSFFRSSGRINGWMEHFVLHYLNVCECMSLFAAWSFWVGIYKCT